MSDVVPRASGGSVGSGRAGRPSGSLKPQKINLDKLNSTAMLADNNLRETEDAVVALREAEERREGLYRAADDQLAAKYGIGDQ